jgi:NADPH:quinone reductase-like Zn-dependent oxidoreductase
MKAVTFSQYGGPEVLHVAEVDEPHPGPGQVRIAVRAAGVNPIDWKARSGMLREIMPVSFPAIDGREAAGVVDEVGPDAIGAIGDEVFGFAVGGAAAEYAILDDLAPKPAALSWEEAAGLPVAAETSVRVFNVLGGVGAGQTLLIDGAAGGVGALRCRWRSLAAPASLVRPASATMTSCARSAPSRRPTVPASWSASARWHPMAWIWRSTPPGTAASPISSR